MHLQLLLLSARSLTPLVGVPPLGALLVAVPGAAATLRDALHVLHFARSYPWCPVICPPVLHPAELEPHGIPAGRVVLVDLEGELAGWRAAVRGRPLPTYQDWITTLALRVDATRTQRVRCVFEKESEGSAIRRQLRQAGLPSPGDWRDILLGCICLADALRTGDPIGVIASRHNLTGTRLASIAKRCFGMGWHELRALGAWEPALEQALRFMKVVVEPSLPPSLPPITRWGDGG